MDDIGSPGMPTPSCRPNGLPGMLFSVILDIEKIEVCLDDRDSGRIAVQPFLCGKQRCRMHSGLEN